MGAEKVVVTDPPHFFDRRHVDGIWYNLYRVLPPLHHIHTPAQAQLQRHVSKDEVQAIYRIYGLHDRAWLPLRSLQPYSIL